MCVCLCTVPYIDVSFDVIIDDGCHRISCIATTYQHLIPYLSPEGVYIVEDFPKYAYSDQYHDKMTPNSLFGKDRTFVFDDASIISKGGEFGVGASSSSTSSSSSSGGSGTNRILLGGGGPTLNEQMIVIASSKSLARPILEEFRANDKVVRNSGGNTAKKDINFIMTYTEDGRAILEKSN